MVRGFDPESAGGWFHPTPATISEQRKRLPWKMICALRVAASVSLVPRRVCLAVRAPRRRAWPKVGWARSTGRRRVAVVGEP